eukprot:1138600-Pelagomonas_calceolata.AAC.9
MANSNASQALDTVGAVWGASSRGYVPSSSCSNFEAAEARFCGNEWSGKACGSAAMKQGALFVCFAAVSRSETNNT